MTVHLPSIQVKASVADLRRFDMTVHLSADPALNPYVAKLLLQLLWSHSH